MAEQRVQRRLAAILAADVVGYSRMMREDEVGTLARMKALRSEVFDPITELHGGRVFKNVGDGVLVEFESAVGALLQATEVQAALAERNRALPENQRVALRIGINVGDVIAEQGDVFGDAVNIAARLEGLAEPGGICISKAIHEQVRHKLDLAYEDIGEHAVKNFDEPLNVLRVGVGEARVESASPLTPDRIFDRPAVAVLPFDNIGGDPEQDYFADGLTEDIITALSLWKSFPVISRNSTFSYKGASPDVRQVADELGARYIVEGSVRRGGNRVRVTAQLIDAKTGHHVWADRYDRELADVFELQDELTQRIAAIVAPELERAERSKVVARPPNRLSAWEHVQRGIERWREFSPEGTSAAIDHFDAAVTADNSYSDAHGWLAYCWMRQHWLGFTEDPDGTLERLVSAARRSVELDETNFFAHVTLSLAMLWSKKINDAVSEAEISIELNPNTVEGRAMLGHALAMSGELHAGVASTMKALQLNPRDPRNHVFMIHLALAYLIGREFESAAEWSQKAIQRKPDMAEYHFLLSTSLAHTGNIEAAHDSLKECLRLAPEFPPRWAATRPYIKSNDVEMVIDGIHKAGWEG